MVQVQNTAATRVARYYIININYTNIVSCLDIFYNNNNDIISGSRLYLYLPILNICRFINVARRLNGFVVEYYPFDTDKCHAYLPYLYFIHSWVELGITHNIMHTHYNIQAKCTHTAHTCINNIYYCRRLYLI